MHLWLETQEAKHEHGVDYPDTTHKAERGAQPTGTVVEREGERKAGNDTVAGREARHIVRRKDEERETQIKKTSISYK